MMVGLLLTSGVIIFLLIVLVVRQRSSDSSVQSAQSVLLLQNELEALRSSVGTLSGHLNQQLAVVQQAMQNQTSAVGGRLDTAARIIGDVQRNLGELGQATKEIRELGMSVSKLDEILRAPKLRGGLGEFLLEELLRQVLPPAQYRMQYRFRSGAAVDAVVLTSGMMTPIDSKFPLENFRKMSSALSDDERASFRKAFIADVRRHIDAIASKYICPDEGTFPFALMYIPAETVYYELIVRDDLAAQGTDLSALAAGQNVIPVSPNTLYAYLQVVAIGLRGMQIETHALEIVNGLSRLQGDLTQLREVFDVLGTHLDNAQKKYGDAAKRLSGVELRFDGIAAQSTDDGTGQQDSPRVKLVS